MTLRQQENIQLINVTLTQGRLQTGKDGINLIREIPIPLGPGRGHFNKQTKQWVNSPHVHDPKTLGGVRNPYPWEIPGKP
ncbi:periplasmic component [Paenibacillus popilliae ATCC 14706]|uniref:Periplasmic component n=1 Tax=Paenibacillus popilliae ATCC 14706 TaxID=1212764 RepID=M9M061_PAEPP|nr:periplasmic component [Paenibacillus popilliae ATCC 14706]